MSASSSPVLFAPIFPQPEKPLIVLLPGLDGTGKLFGEQVQVLSPYFDIRCLKIPESNRQGWESLAGSVVELIYHAQGDRPTYLCGESFGGCLALQVALTAPELLSQLVMINPASALRRHFWLRGMAQTAAFVPEWLFNVSGAFALSVIANFDRIEKTQQELFIKTVRPISQACVMWRLEMLHQFEVATERLQQLSTPTTLLASGRDHLLPSQQEAALLQRHLPNAAIYPLPESGHACLIERDVDLAQCFQALNLLPHPAATTPAQTAA